MNTIKLISLTKIKIILIIIILACILKLQLSFAHPGNTASDGCHYCRTNCDSWGEAWDQRHCHGSSSSTEASSSRNYSSPEVYTLPKQNSAYSYDEEDSYEDSTWMWVSIIGVGGFLYLIYKNK